MAIELTGMEGEFAALRAEINAFEQQAVNELKKVTRTTLEALFSQTPVWSGETAAAYDIGIGAPTSGGPAGYSGGPPGPTSTQAMGTEANRPGAEAVSRRAVESKLASMRSLNDIYFGNGVAEDKWNLVDSGRAPNKEMARNPAGVQKPAEVIARAKSGGIVG